MGHKLFVSHKELSCWGVLHRLQIKEGAEWLESAEGVDWRIELMMDLLWIDSHTHFKTVYRHRPPQTLLHDT